VSEQLGIKEKKRKEKKRKEIWEMEQVGLTEVAFGSLG
jgi:hypothetical protein